MCVYVSKCVCVYVNVYTDALVCTCMSLSVTAKSRMFPNSCVIFPEHVSVGWDNAVTSSC